MARRKSRYPLTLSLVSQSMLDVFTRMANIKLNVVTDNEMARIGSGIQTVTVLEQFLRLVLEIDLDEKGGAGRRVVVESVKGIDGAVSLSASRIESSGYTF